jgi:hypothetical protein
MRKISESFENLENRDIIKASKSLLWKDKEKYICANGHANVLRSDFCENLNCLQNIKGLTKNQIRRIENFKNKVEILNSLFEQN